MRDSTFSMTGVLQSGVKDKLEGADAPAAPATASSSSACIFWPRRAPANAEPKAPAEAAAPAEVLYS